jgi:hypothetical protein
MLRAIISQSGSPALDRQALVRCFSEAFCLSEGQAYSIFGWFPDGTGKLADAELDYLLAKKIEQTRQEWALAS